MSAFNSFRGGKQISASSESSDDAPAAHLQKKSKAGGQFAEEEEFAKLAAGATTVKSEKPGAVTSPHFAAASDATFDDLFCAPSFNSMGMQQPAPAKSTLGTSAEPFVETEEHEYIRENCLKPSTNLKTFDDIVGVPHVVAFAHQYEPVVTGARRAISGLLLFGPSGTGKTASAQAITSSIGGTFYQFSAANLPSNFAKQANRIDALFEVALSGPLPAVIFLDEVDTFLSARATARVGHFATKFERFTNSLLVIGATNEPKNIAPKILTGRFERKILIDNPNEAARRALIMRQLAQEEHEHILSASDLFFIIQETNGRSAVNLERLVSTAVTKADGMPVSRADFDLAMEEEPSDFDLKVAAANREYDQKHGWRGGAA